MLVSLQPESSCIASIKSLDWYAIASRAALIIWFLLAPLVNPKIAPLAYISQWGAPNPVKAGTMYTPPLSLTFFAKYSVSAASLTSLSSSLIHWITAPPTNTDPSRAYWTFPSIPTAIVVRSPFLLLIIFSPVFISKKQPVPYVFLTLPSSKQVCPNKAHCWSPAIPAIGTLTPPVPPKLA